MRCRWTLLLGLQLSAAAAGCLRYCWTLRTDLLPGLPPVPLPKLLDL